MSYDGRYADLITEMKEAAIEPVEFHRRIRDLAITLHDFDVVEHCNHAIAAFSAPPRAEAPVGADPRFVPSGVSDRMWREQAGEEPMEKEDSD